MKKPILLLGCLLAAIPCSADTIDPADDLPAACSPWKSLGGDFRRSGLSKYSGPEIGCVKWKFETDGPVSASATVGFDGTIHIACEDGKLYTLDPNGSELWNYDANSPLLSSPTLGSDGSVYVGSEEGKLYAIDTNGNLRWTHDTEGPVYSSPAVSADGNNIYVGSQDGILYALAEDGSELWSFETKGPGKLPTGSILASPAIGADGTVYIAGLYDPNLYALDPNDGKLKWWCNFQSQGWPFASPVVADDGTIYQTLLYDSSLYAIEPNNGAIIWSTDLAEPSSGWFDPSYAGVYPDPDGWSEPALASDGTIYVSLDDPYLRAIDPNGNIKWVTHLGVMGSFTLTVDSDGLIYAAGDDGYLRIVEPNGMEVAQFQSDAWLNFPVIAADNVIIVGDANDNTMLITDRKNTLQAIVQYGCEDLNADERVDFVDLALLAGDWLECTDTDWPCHYQGQEQYLAGDIDRDRYVRSSDLATIADRWLGNVGRLKPPPCLATNPNPANGAIGVSTTPSLSWTGCPDASWHDVYFASDQIAVASATRTTWGIFRRRQPRFQTDYMPTGVPLEWGKTYYWRIDEVSTTETRVGTVWRFTVRTRR